jgi:hypothetical protein
MGVGSAPRLTQPTVGGSTLGRGIRARRSDSVGLIPRGETGDSGAGIGKDRWRQKLSGPVPNGVNGRAGLRAKVFVAGAGCCWGTGALLSMRSGGPRRVAFECCPGWASCVRVRGTPRGRLRTTCSCRCGDRLSSCTRLPMVPVCRSAVTGGVCRTYRCNTRAGIRCRGCAYPVVTAWAWTTPRLTRAR